MIFNESNIKLSILTFYNKAENGHKSFYLEVYVVYLLSVGLKWSKYVVKVTKKVLAYINV